jgi:tripartite ATP-independent transporter DctP family solute receptor
MPGSSGRIALVKASLALLSCLAAATAWASPRVLTAGIGLNADTPQGKAMQRFADTVQARTQGRLRIDLHTSAQLGDDVKMVKALQAGQQDITCPDSSTLAPLVKDFSAINYPFTFLNTAEADAILDGDWGQRLLAKLPEQRLVGLAFWENGFRHLTNSRQPIAHLKDVSGVRIRVMQNPMLIDSFRQMGFDAVPMPFPKVYDALKSKEVDGQENPLPTILSSRFYEVQPYLTLSRHVYSAFVLLVSKQTWDSLPEADRAVLASAAVEARDEQRRMNREMTASALDQLKARGMQVSSIDVQEAESVRRRLRDVLDHYNREIGESAVVSMYIDLSRLRAQSESGTLARQSPKR